MKKNELKKLISKIFIKHKLSKNHATICAEALVNAELVGAPSHGLSRLKMYCDRINKGVINPRPKIKIKKITQSITQIDAKNSIGFVAADIGIKKAINKCLYDETFISSLNKLKNPYGDGNAAEQIVDVLENVKLDLSLIQKEICYDL